MADRPVCRVVIVGGSIAAVESATALRELGFDGNITLLSDEQRPPYLRVPLSKGVLAGHQSPESVTLSALGDDVDVRLGARAAGLDLARREVHVAGSGVLSYDKLVVATGSRARRLTPAGTGEQVLRSLDDCLALRDRLADARSVLVIGGGFLGMEVASTCLDLGKEVTVVDREPPLTRLIGPLLAAHLTESARAAGARIVISPAEVALVPDDERMAVVLPDGTRLTAEVVVSAVGDVPNVEWLQGSGLAVRGGLRVDSRCRASADVVAAGDVTFTQSSTGWRRTPHWTNAVEQARAAAATVVLGDEVPAYTPTPYYWSEQFGISLRLAGIFPPTGLIRTVDGDLTSASALLTWTGDTGAITSAAAVNHHTPAGRLKRILSGERQPALGHRQASHRGPDWWATPPGRAPQFDEHPDGRQIGALSPPRTVKEKPPKTSSRTSA